MSHAASGTGKGRLAGTGESNGRVGAGVAALLVWVRAELRLTEGSVLLAMGEPMGNDRVMLANPAAEHHTELSCALNETTFSQVFACCSLEG